MYNFCTLFDKNYFYKGLTMYNSLATNCSEDFNLWILCMDDTTYELLKKINLPNIKLVSLNEFESTELLKVKKERGLAEYSWTCASNFIWFLLQKHQEIEKVIYLDADLYFFNDPKILIEELGNDDVMITEHRYTKEYDQTDSSGKYCVQFMVFKNNANGLKVLDWWRQACLDWCFSYLDKGRFGDQKYLDDWTSRFNGIYELKHLGGGVAPWNVQQYNFFIKEGKIFGQSVESSNSWPLVFYHFHEFYLVSKDKYFASPSYRVKKSTQKIIHDFYFKALQENIKSVSNFDPDFNFGYKAISVEKFLIYMSSHFGIIKPIIIALNFFRAIMGKISKI